MTEFIDDSKDTYDDFDNAEPVEPAPAKNEPIKVGLDEMEKDHYTRRFTIYVSGPIKANETRPITIEVQWRHPTGKGSYLGKHQKRLSKNQVAILTLFANHEFAKDPTIWDVLEVLQKQGIKRIARKKTDGSLPHSKWDQRFVEVDVSRMVGRGVLKMTNIPGAKLTDPNTKEFTMDSTPQYALGDAELAKYALENGGWTVPIEQRGKKKRVKA